MRFSRLLQSAFVLAAVTTVAACNGASATSSKATEPAATPTATSGAAAAGAPVAVREVTIPAGTHLPIVLDTSVGSDTSHAEEPVQAHLAAPIEVQGVTVLAAGSRVDGVVTDALQSGKVKGRAHVGVRFDSVTPEGTAADHARYEIETAAVGRTAEDTHKKDALEVGGGAVGGAIVGALVGGKKGALIGTAAGGGAGTAVVLSTRGKEIHLPKGSRLTLSLSKPLTVRVRG